MRLIDANKLKGDLGKLPMMSNWGEIFIPNLIDEQPTIDPETLPIIQELREQLAKVIAERDELKKNARPVVRGEWVKRVNPLGVGDVLTRCNRCGRTSDVVTPFCPWCGADMRGEAR